MNTLHRHPDRNHDDAPDNAWRVILVGRTGLDQALRRIEALELVRSRDALDAIGELSDPIDEHSPEQAAVLVSPDAEPEAEELVYFLDALRLVDPQVRMIRVGDPRDGYDASVHPHASAAQIMTLINETVPVPRIRTRPTPPQDPVAQPSDPAPSQETTLSHETAPAQESALEPKLEPESEPEPQQIKPHEPEPIQDPVHDQVMTTLQAPPEEQDPAPRSRTHTSSDLIAEHEVLAALSQARPVTQAALDCIRIRLAHRSIVLSDAPDAPGLGIPVAASGSVFGVLTSTDHDWLTKQHGLEQLKPHAAWLGSLLRLESQQRELRESAFTDELTGAWNRRYFTRFLDAAIEHSRAARRTLTVLYFDIDNFKTYNDRHGHDAGDEILVETVRLLSSVIRPSDRVCRIGGDEFVVIFYEPEGPRDPSSNPPESIYDIAKRFQKQVNGHSFPKLGDEAQGTLTISGGLASYPWDGADAKSLLRHADELALQSKRQGKNVITLGRGAEGVCKPTTPP